MKITTENIRPIGDDSIEEALVRGFQAAGPDERHEVFEALYARLEDRVYGICYRFTGNRTEALDAAQNAFISIYQSLEDFRFDSRFSSWAYRVAANAAIDLSRRAARSRMESYDPRENADEELRMKREAPSSIQTEHHELEVKIQGALDRISEKLRTALVLRHFAGLSYAEIGEALGVCVGTVKSRLGRANAALEKNIDPVFVPTECAAS